ncbi:MAG: ABC transporter permease [Nitrososphaerota archaeon]|jgi:hypothetical protein|nr:ABC transporter permease [Nitrososphaerota archaeon]
MFGTGWTLLKAEMGKVWDRPILEITVALMSVLVLSSASPHFSFELSSQFSANFWYMLTGSVSLSVKALLLPLVVMCGVLVALSFARDYESGLMQSVLSLPVSRKMFFVAKFFAIILPLTLLSWGFTTFFVGLTFYPEFWLVLKASFFVLPVVFLVLMFCGGIGVLVSLMIKRTIPSVLAALLVNIFFWYPTSVDTVNTLREGVGYANYLCLTPYKGALVFLDRLTGYTPPRMMGVEDALEFSLSTSSTLTQLNFRVEKFEFSSCILSCKVPVNSFRASIT